MIVGEISLNGEIHGVAGVLPRVIRARELGLRFCVIPEENIREGNLVKDMPVFGVKSLNDMIRCLRDPNTYTAAYQEKEKTGKTNRKYQRLILREIPAGRKEPGGRQRSQ